MIETLIWENEVEVRKAGDSREIHGIVVPYDTPSGAALMANREVAYEIIRPGALSQSINQRGDRIPLTWYHPPANEPHADQKIIGVSKADAWQMDGINQRAGFTLLKSQLAEEALDAIEKNVVRCFSISFRDVPHRKPEILRTNAGAKVYVRSEVALQHVALVPAGAYAQAAVDEVRALYEGFQYERRRTRARSRARY